MSKVVAFFLITVFLCANTSIGQLLKVPNLIEHYIEHKNEVDTNSFVEFIKLHYSNNSQNNEKKHQNLPFKTFENTTHLLFVFSIVNFNINTINSLISVKKTFFYKNSFKSNLFTSIWLPPKIA